MSMDVGGAALLDEVRALLRRFVGVVGIGSHGGGPLGGAHICFGSRRLHAVPERHLAREAKWEISHSRSLQHGGREAMAHRPRHGGRALPQDPCRVSNTPVGRKRRSVQERRGVQRSVARHPEHWPRAWRYGHVLYRKGRGLLLPGLLDVLAEDDRGNRKVARHGGRPVHPHSATAKNTA